MNDDIPDLGDMDGMTRLMRRAIEAVEKMELPDHERQAWIAEIEAAFDAVAGEGPPQFDLDRVPLQS